MNRYDHGILEYYRKQLANHATADDLAVDPEDMGAIFAIIDKQSKALARVLEIDPLLEYEIKEITEAKNV